MGITFLAPVFLAGLAAIAIPILIHLTHRERKEAVPFPSLMFVRRIPYRTVRRQRIRHWLLFVMRCLAIVLIVGAFARPLLDRATSASAAFTGARELVVLLDRSHSMGHSDRWSRAVGAARRVLGEIGPDDRATLVLFAERADAVTQRTADPSVLAAALASAEVGAGVTRYGPALQLARELIERSDRPRGVVVLISDFQRTGWDPRQTVRLPDGVTLTPINVGDAAAVNLAVTGATLARSRDGSREQVSLAARVANLSDQAMPDVRVALELDGEPIQAQAVSLDPRSSAQVRFAPVVAPQRPAAGVIRAGDDPLPGDNQHRFVLTPSDPLSVLVLEARGAGANASLYLGRALRIGSDPGFEVEVKNVARLQPADLTGQAVVVLNDAPPPAAVARRLRSFVSQGGGLLVVLGRRSPPAAWSAEGLELLPGTPGAPVDRSSEGGGTVGSLDYDHPVFEIFRGPRSGDFSAPRFFRFRRLAVAEGSRALARFDDGSAALTEGRVGAGRVLVWSSDLENFWNDLAIQPVFLPYAHRLIRYLSDYREPGPWFRVGELVDLTLDPRLDDLFEANSEFVIESPSGKRSVRRPGAEAGYLRLDEAGFYQLRSMEAGEGRAFILAANLDPAESDLTPIDPAELAGTVGSREAAEGGVTETAALSDEDRERRQGLWWYLLVVAGALLLAETLVSNRISARVKLARQRGYADAN